jgi:hypothetical protein
MAAEGAEMTGYSPGPWKRESRYVVTETGFHICKLYAAENREQNAQLMAAAPDLLEVLLRYAIWAAKNPAQTDELKSIEEQMQAAIYKAILVA